jgi:CubicO group peptidase (beta-lactamase class C family)
MKIRSLLPLGLVFCAISALAQRNKPDAVQQFVNGYLARNKIPGVALLVRKDGELVRAEGYGMANLEQRVRVKPETVFQSGSMGKQFTAMAVMTLVEEQKLALDDPVGKYLPVPATWNEITVRHLLTHTSGLGDYPTEFSLQKDYTEDDLFKMVTERPLQFAAGEKWSYSNLGYLTLGVLIHKVSGKFYGDLLRERVFGPLGMTRTRIINEADIIADRAAGYRMKNGEVKNQEWVSPTLNTTADGSLYFTVLDLAKWDAALEQEKLVSHASYEQIWSPVKLKNGSTAPYGFGWGVQKAPNGNRLIEHGGAWQGFTTYIARYPDDRLTVVVLCNMAGAAPGFIAHRVAGMYNATLMPPGHKAVKLDPVKLKAYEGVYQLEEDKISIKVVGNEGRMQVSLGSHPRELVPESETNFFEEDSDRTYHFVRENGKVTAVEIAVPEKIVFKKIE